MKKALNKGIWETTPRVTNFKGTNLKSLKPLGLSRGNIRLYRGHIGDKGSEAGDKP